MSHSTAALLAPCSLEETQTDWRSRGYCTSFSPDLFYSEEPDDIEAAKAVCSGCPSRSPCLEYAMTNKEDHGIWGGTTPPERRTMRRYRNMSPKAAARKQLRRLTVKLGRVPRVEDIQSAYREGLVPPIWRLKKTFGCGYAQIIEQCGLKELDALRHLELLWRRLGYPPSPIDVARSYRAGETPSPRQYQRLFGSVTAARLKLTKKGLPEGPNRAILAAQRKEAQRKAALRRRNANLGLIQLNALWRELGRPPTAADIRAASSLGKCPAVSSVETYYGSIAKGLKLAGIPDPKENPHWSNEELLGGLKKLAELVGRIPEPRDINWGSKQKICAFKTTYIRRFGSVEAANEAAGLI
jgi:WhiB family transcriptional regulator, redox-sensing transcriptional regulator